MKTKYYVTSSHYIWRHRYYKTCRAPKWEKLVNDELNNIDEVIKTHKFKFDTYPDNDDYHVIIEYDVQIKKVTEEII